MPALWRRQVVAGTSGAAGVCRLRVPDFGDGGDDFPRYAYTVAGLVSSDVVDDHAEERSQRAGTTAGVVSTVSSRSSSAG